MELIAKDPLNMMLISKKCARALNELDNPIRKNPIDCNNWNYKSDVQASFAIWHDDHHIYLKYYVEESYAKAQYTEINQPVYEDSCVEFFISFDGKNYYNLEFNCIGNCLGGYGSNRSQRKRLPNSLLEQIILKPSLGFNRIEIIERKTSWTLDVTIPKTLFNYDNIVTISGLRARCNVYKCGDKQVFPHYLSWSPVLADKPDFHLPQFFGDVLFVKK